MYIQNQVLKFLEKFGRITSQEVDDSIDAKRHHVVFLIFFS